MQDLSIKLGEPSMWIMMIKMRTWFKIVSCHMILITVSEQLSLGWDIKLHESSQLFVHFPPQPHHIKSWNQLKRTRDKSESVSFSASSHFLQSHIRINLDRAVSAAWNCFCLEIREFEHWVIIPELHNQIRIKTEESNEIVTKTFQVVKFWGSLSSFLYCRECKHPQLKQSQELFSSFKIYSKKSFASKVQN